MTNEKMIEEMAQDIAKRDCHLYDKCPKEHKYNCISQEPDVMLESSKNYITIATWLVNAGYRKLPENAVVTTREMYDELYKKANLYEYQKENAVVLTREEYTALINEFNALQQKYDDICDRYRLCKNENETIKQHAVMVRKETTREVLDKVYDWGQGFFIEHSLMEEDEFNGILDEVKKLFLNVVEVKG